MKNRFALSKLATEPSNGLLETSKADPWSGAVRRDLNQGVRSVEQFIGSSPLLCLGAGLVVGMVLGWWVKRT